MPDDIEKIQKILGSYMDKNFVQRILTPELYPNLDLGAGRTGTHLMGWEKFGNKNIVFPHIIYNKKTNSLIQLSPQKAYDYALESSEYIPFDNQEEADWFSKNYKNIWEKR